jgi:hypothetical protein
MNRMKVGFLGNDIISWNTIRLLPGCESFEYDAPIVVFNSEVLCHSEEKYW